MRNIFVSDSLGGHWEAIDGVIEYDLGDCGRQINDWKKRFFTKKHVHPAKIQLRCFYKAPETILWKYYLELIIDGKIVEQHRIREEAFDVLSTKKPKEEYSSSSVLFVEYEVFTPEPKPPKVRKEADAKPIKKSVRTIWDFGGDEPSVLNSL